MSYPKNTASPRALQAKVVNATTGAQIIAGVVAFHIVGTTRVAVVGTAAEHVANGLWTYTPTQAETNYDQFSIEFYHSDAVSGGPLIEVVTDISTGNGPESVALTITDDSDPVINLAGVQVAIYDAGILIGLLTTTGSGLATFNLAIGTYTLRAYKTGYQLAEQILTVEADGEYPPYAMTKLIPDVPIDPAQSLVTITCYTDKLYVRQISPPSTGSGSTGIMFDGTVHAYDMTDESVIIDHTIDLYLWLNAGYEFRGGESGAWKRFTPTTTNFDVASYVGDDGVEK